LKANGELSRLGHIAEQVVEAKFFQKSSAFDGIAQILLDNIKLDGHVKSHFRRRRFYGHMLL
jgi:hypothetical protein